MNDFTTNLAKNTMLPVIDLVSGSMPFGSYGSVSSTSLLLVFTAVLLLVNLILGTPVLENASREKAWVDFSDGRNLLLVKDRTGSACITRPEIVICDPVKDSDTGSEDTARIMKERDDQHIALPTLALVRVLAAGVRLKAPQFRSILSFSVKNSWLLDVLKHL